MNRHFAAFCLLVACFINTANADEPAVCEHCASDASTLRLYFPPDAASSGRNPNGFEPEVAKLYVDDLYVGDAIVNLHGYAPLFRFPKSTVKIRVEMADARKFETKMTFLGHGSTQFLFVDFPHRKTIKGSANTPAPANTSASQAVDK